MKNGILKAECIKTDVIAFIVVVSFLLMHNENKDGAIQELFTKKAAVNRKNKEKSIVV